MKRFILIILLIIPLWSGNSCKKEETPVQTQIPEWLQQKIPELIPDQKLCDITYITIYRYGRETYYHVYCMIWSCMYCQFFDEKGNRPDWDQKEWDNFHSGSREIKKVKACQQ